MPLKVRRWLHIYISERSCDHLIYLLVFLEELMPLEEVLVLQLLLQ